MANFARIDASGVVVDRHVINNEILLDESGVEVESLGQQYLARLWGGAPTDYVQSSYNGRVRGHFPSLNDTYDPDADVFVPSITGETVPVIEPPVKATKKTP
jgi:hypothetical protein